MLATPRLVRSLSTALLVFLALMAFGAVTLVASAGHLPPTSLAIPAASPPTAPRAVAFVTTGVVTQVGFILDGSGSISWDVFIGSAQYAPASIGDRVWRDSNVNGIQDAGESGIGGVEVRLYACTGWMWGGSW